MSLDLIMCKLVKQEEANNAYFVSGEEWYFTKNYYLRRLQETGLIPVREKRVGRNCMNKMWILNHDLMISSEWDEKIEQVIRDAELHKLKTIFPEELKEKLLDHVDTIEDGAWIDMEEIEKGDWDFLWISW